jgi:hypothetical protein
MPSAGYADGDSTERRSRMNVGQLACSAGKGLAAGLVGTAAMTVSSTVEQKLREREASTAPADAAAKVLGIGEFSSDAAKSRFGNIVHWGYGTGWGSVRGLLDAAGLPPAKATAAHTAAVWGSEQVMLPALDVAPPAWEWSREEIVIDAFHHLVYGVATGVAYALISGRSRAK